ncbi:hypothetical protein JQ612_35605 [Bradyrhizobium manausense]|uniref:DMP19 family protein n=1 Tax=Bradyrhizobium manausense TaxID=989370 RepID=UPI001BA4F08B|nr:hypothetical protein [Bradyrhizobium manausense]MBR0838558.1 hypothetical protein [Bradyrhizobium manausense]
MWWMIAAGVVAFLIILYVIGKRDIAREEAIEAKEQGARDGVSTPNLAAEKPLVSYPSDEWTEEQEVVFYANTFHGYFTNGGLDTLLSVIGMRDLSLNTMCEALTAVGAQPIVPFLKQASLESAPRGDTDAYLGRMRELGAAIDKLELNVGQLSQAYARRHGIDWYDAHLAYRRDGHE